MEQMNMFAAAEAESQEARELELFERWKQLPEVKFIKDGDPERENVHQMMRGDGWKLFRFAIHVCHQMPADKEIWLNEIEAPEFWVMNDTDDPCGELVETCPFCGVDLKHRHGDVALMKTGASWWRQRGLM